MSTEVIDIKINAAQAASSVAELKKSLKALKDEQLNVEAGSLQFKKLSQAINDTEGKIGDLTDSFNTLKGSGIERTNASLGLLREGFQNFDLEKIKIGFNGIGAAMSAVPIFLLVEGFKYLIEDFKEVVAFGKQLFDIFSDEERAIKSLNRELELQKETTAKLSKEISREIEIMEAQGASHSKILAKKKELIQTQIDEAVATAKLNIAKIKEVQNNDSVYESYLRTSAAVLKKIGADEQAEKIEQQIALNKAERNKENTKALNENLELIKDLRTKEKVEEIKVAVEIRKAKEEIGGVEYLQQKANTEIAIEKKKNEEILINAEDAKAQEDLMNDKYRQLDLEKSKAHQEALNKTRLDLATQGLKSTQALSDLFFQMQLNQAVGNDKKQREIKKKAFEVDKAFQIAQATIDGYRAVLSAYAGAPPGFKIASGVLAGIFAAAQVAKIAATKYNDGGASSAPNIDTGSGGSAPSTVPQLNTQAPTTQASTLFDQNGKNLSITAKVYAGEMTSQQKREAKLDQQATI